METRLDATMWLMFKAKNLPNGVSSIYVPLKKVDWYWQAKATRDVDGDFQVDSANTSNSVNPQGIHTTDFPVWTTLATGKEPWQHIQP
jgi:hypothetical protein